MKVLFIDNKDFSYKTNDDGSICIDMITAVRIFGADKVIVINEDKTGIEVKNSFDRPDRFIRLVEKEEMMELILKYT